MVALMQAAIIAGPPVPPDFNLSIAPPQDRSCPKDADGAIIVCGSPDKNERHRLRPLPEDYVDENRVMARLPGNATIAPGFHQGRFGEGQLLVTLSIPF